MTPPNFWRRGTGTGKVLWSLALAAGLSLGALAAPWDDPGVASGAQGGASKGAAAAGSPSAAMADALLAALDAGVEPTLAGSVRFASLAAALQAGGPGTPGTPLRAAPAHDSPSAALSALLAAHGVAPTLAQTVDMARLDLMAEPARGALARMVDAFLAHALASEATFAGLDPAALEAARTRAPAAEFTLADLGVDVAPVLSTRAAFLDTVVALRQALGPARSSDGPTQVAPLFSLDFGSSDNTYTQDFALLWDEGGNDAYFNNAGGTRVCVGQPCLVGVTGAAALVDKMGDDRYVGGRGQGANGGGYLGSGLLIDEAGNDEYVARDDGTNGAAMAGLGLLIDQGGDDTFTALGWGVNGGGYIGGVGFLWDRGGNDAYVGSDSGVNGGGLAGRGLLVDDGGSDYYEATALGANGGAVGGIGVLLDRGGVDTYFDRAGGTGVDRTVIPKEFGGVQFDA